ncbi:MAG: GNAT family N-acetyltransferase [Jatrophihabitans sp.]
MVTDPARRGRGHGRQLVAAARSRMLADERDLALFTCDRELRGFYERAGFEVLAGTVLLGGTPEHPLPSDELGKLVLARFFSDHAKAAAAGFQRCALALYPGERDRLW